MNQEIRNQILSLIETAIHYSYPIRWADHKTTLGDFDGRNFTIDVFRIPSSKQLEFLDMIEPIRKKIRELMGNKGIFIFHSPEATKKFYSHLFPITKNIHFEKNGIKIPLPDISGTEGKPLINESSIYLKYRNEAA